MRTLFEPKEDYYEQVKIGKAFSSNYFEYESNGNKDKTLSIEEYLVKNRPCLNHNYQINPTGMENSVNNIYYLILF